MRWMVSLSLQLRFLVVILAGALMAFGIVQLRTMPVDVLPEFDPPTVEVQTEALGLSAAEVESLITTPMEADLLNGVAWLDQIYSESVAGLSSILLVFEPGTDPIRARQMVQERLTQAHALPNVSSPPVMLQPLATSSRLMMIGLSSENISLIDLGVLAHWNVKPRLMGVPGVANVAIWGQRDRQLQVQVDPQRLQAAGVTLEQIVETTGEALWVSPLSYLEASSPGTAGWIDTPNQRLGIRHSLPIETPADLAKLPVVGSPGVLLGDVATVVEDHQPLIGDAILKNGSGLLLVVQKFPGANTLQVTKDVEAALEAMKPGLAGIAVDASIFRAATYIELSISNLSLALLIGALLIVLVLSTFFFSWRTALISLVTIPLSLLAAVFVLYLRGATFNVLVLAGLVIALGVAIDDVVVAVENIARRLRQNRNTDNPAPATNVIIAASLELRSPLVFATLIMLLAMTPIFFLEGLSGTFFQPLVLSYGLALFASLLVTLTVTSALCLILLSNGHLAHRDSPLMSWLQHSYNGLLKRVLPAAYPTLAVVCALVLSSLALLPLVWQPSLLPSFKQTDLLIQWEGVAGTSSEAMSRITAQVSRELSSVPGVRNVGSHVGRAVTGDKTVGVNAGELWISLDPAANYAATLAAVQTVVDGYPGLFRTVQTYLPERLNEALTGAEQSVVVRIYGNDLPVLREKAEEIRQVMAKVSGVVATNAELPIEEPQVEIKVDLAAAQRYQIKPGDVRRAATTLLSGLHVGDLFEDQKVFAVVVWGVPELRSSLSSLSDLLIDTPSGEQVRLGDVAEVRIVPAPTQIRRDAVSRFVDVSATVRDRNLTEVATDMKRIVARVVFPLEYHAEVLNDSVERQAAVQRSLIYVLVAMVGMFLLVQAAFTNWRVAFVTFLSTPVALTGGVLAASLSGGISLGSLIGFIAVFGLAVRHGIVLISRFQQLAKDEDLPFGSELVLRGASERLGPILMTTLATALALLPFVVFGSVPGLEIISPMAVVILGGLLTTLLLNLFIAPTLYLRFGAAPIPVTERARFATAGQAAD